MSLEIVSSQLNTHLYSDSDIQYINDNYYKLKIPFNITSFIYINTELLTAVLDCNIVNKEYSLTENCFNTKVAIALLLSDLPFNGKALSFLIKTSPNVLQNTVKPLFSQFDLNKVSEIKKQIPLKGLIVKQIEFCHFLMQHSDTRKKEYQINNIFLAIFQNYNWGRLSYYYSLLIDCLCNNKEYLVENRLPNITPNVDVKALIDTQLFNTYTKNKILRADEYSNLGFVYYIAYFDKTLKVNKGYISDIQDELVYLSVLHTDKVVTVPINNVYWKYSEVERAFNAIEKEILRSYTVATRRLIRQSEFDF